MPFPSALSSDNQTTRRKGGLFERYLIVHAPSVKLQFHPSANSSENVNATIPYTSAISGSYTNVLLGMTVIISPTSDYAADLRNQPENCFVTYIRLAATSTVLSIGATKYQFATGDYVTVLDDYRVFERKLRAVSASDIRRDWSISFRKPKPRIYGLYATVVSTSTSSASVAFTPSAEVMAASGTISTWAWNVADGTITSGSSSTQNITVSFPLGTRYVHLTVTDSNGVSNYLTALIAVIPESLASVIHLRNTDFAITKSLNSGNRAEFIAESEANWLDGSQGIIATFASYRDGTSALTTSMTGWLKNISDRVAGDAEEAILMEMSATIEGIAYYAGQIQSEGFYTELRTTPAKWGQFNRLSPYDCLWYLVSEHSTLANVAAFDYPGNHTDFKFSEINIPSGTMLDVINILTFRCLGGTPNWSPNGEIVFRQSLMYATSDSDRNAATVYATYEDVDSFSVELSRLANSEIKAVGQIIMGCAAYNTTTKIPRVYMSKAPAGDESGYLREELDAIILPADQSDSNNRLVAGKFTANHFFTINENPGLTLSLLDGYHTIEPSAFQWHKFLLTDSVSGAILSSSDRFLCTELQIAYNDAEATIAVEASFRKESNGGSNYLQESVYVSTNQPNVQPFIPQFVPTPFLDTPVTDADIYDTETEGGNDNTGGNGVQDPTLPPVSSGEATPPADEVIETIYVPLFNNTAVFNTIALEDDASYIFRITGQGIVGSSGGTFIHDFARGAKLGWEPNVFSSLFYDRAEWTGTAWKSIVNPEANNVLDIELPLAADPSSTFQISVMRWYVDDTTPTTYNYFYNLPYVSSSISGTLTGPNEYSANVSYSHGAGGTGFGIEISIFFVPPTRSITKVEFDYTGIPPATLQGAKVLNDPFSGDAFYIKYDIDDLQAYPVNKGLKVNGSFPTPPAYSAGHVYEIPFTGTGAVVPFQFFDPQGDYSDNTQAYFKVEIIRV